MPADQGKLWESIVGLYIQQKHLLLLGEELLLGFGTFIQPALEQKHTLDHIMRALAVEQGTMPGVVDPGSEIDDTERYTIEQLGKAKGHLYRAFFDTADWFSSQMRESIFLLLDPYSTECLTSVFPEYYKGLRSKIEAMSTDIARIREHKDIEKKKDVMLREVEEYTEKILEIARIRKTIFEKIPALQDYRSRRLRGKVGRYVAATVIGVVVTLLVKWLAG